MGLKERVNVFAKQVLSQLSYTPHKVTSILKHLRHFRQRRRARVYYRPAALSPRRTRQVDDALAINRCFSSVTSHSI